VVERLRDPAGSAAADGQAPLVSEPQAIEHQVKFYEKGDRPLEFITTRQWFVRILEHKDELLAAGDQVKWHPDFMRLRYKNWTENLNLDWCISRQRYFGVSFPVWYPVDGSGEAVFDAPVRVTFSEPYSQAPMEELMRRQNALYGLCDRFPGASYQRRHVHGCSKNSRDDIAGGNRSGWRFVAARGGAARSLL